MCHLNRPELVVLLTLNLELDITFLIVWANATPDKERHIQGPAQTEKGDRHGCRPPQGSRVALQRPPYGSAVGQISVIGRISQTRQSSRPSVANRAHARQEQ